MLTNVEFYICPDGSINVQRKDGPLSVYDHNCRDITEEMLLKIRDLYPKAFAALSRLYVSSRLNRPFYEYQIVHRFIRCNFGEFDSTFDISDSGRLILEEVKCPLRGECVFEGTICKAKMKTVLSDREMEVAKRLGRGMSKTEIAEDLRISICTVARHIANIKSRLKLAHSNQIVAWFSRQDIN